jgi:thermostable 8-oxoguanine DNA glycosylase
MGATLTDTVLQAGVNYTTVVKPRVQQILQQFPEAQTTSGFLALLQRETPEKLLNWQPGRKPNTLLALATVLASEGLEVEAAVRLWLQQETNRAKLRTIHGIGPKSIDYLQILVGGQSVAVDRHIYAFLANAGFQNVTYEMAHRLVSEAARLLDVPLATLDHSIWRYMAQSNENDA